MKKKGYRLLALLMAAAMTTLTACSGSDTAGDTSAADSAAVSGETPAEIAEGASISQQQDVVAAVNVDFTTMDPMDTSDTLSGGIQRMIMDGLFGFDDDMNIYPMLATGYEANEDATEFTITLREGISFTDGTSWNADAALANFAKWDDETLGLKRTTFLCNILDTYEKVDDYTIKVKLTEPFGAFISNLAHPACVVMSPKQIEAGVEACASSPVGTGQYKFVEWIEGDHLTLELNTEWWGYDADICGGTALADSDAGFRTITFRPVTESATRVAMLQSGDAQIIWPTPTESVAVLEADPNVTSYTDEGLVVRFIMLNTQKEPYTDKRVRQAIDYAIDKDAYIQVVKNGLATKADSVIAPAVQYHKANEIREYNVEKAKELLAEAGYPDGFDMTLYIASTTSREKMAQMLQYYWGEIGVNLEIVSSTMAEWSASVVDSWQSDAVNSYGVSWNSNPDPYGYLDKFFNTQTIHASSNAGGYSNEEIDAKLVEAFSLTDQEERTAIYDEIMKQVMSEYTGLYYAYECRNWAVSERVNDAILRADSQMIVTSPFNNVWLAQ